MTFARPTLPQIIARVADDLGPAASLRRSPERALSRSVGGVSHSLHGHIDWASRQVIPSSTTDETQLAEWAAMFGITRKQPTQGTGDADGTGTNGAVVPAGTVLQYDDGTRFTVDTEATVAGGVLTISVTSEDYSSDANADLGATLRLVTPISGVNSAFTLAADITDGTDLEDIETFRDRLLDRMQTPTRGGSEADYIAWARATPGVSVGNAYVLKDYYGDGTIGVCFTIDDPDDPIPRGGDETTVTDYVTALAPAVLRQFGAFGPTAAPVTYNIQIAPYPSTAVQNAIKASIRDLHRREAIPGGTLLLSHINEAISTATGETDHVLVAPVADVVASTSIELATYDSGAFTFGAIV